MITNDECWNVIRNHDKSALDAEAKRLQRYKKASQENTTGLAIASENWPAQLACTILQAHISRQCRCSTYPRSQKLHANHEKKYHFVTITNTTFDEKEWVTNIERICKQCGKKWQSFFNEAGHSPTSTWRELKLNCQLLYTPSARKCSGVSSRLKLTVTHHNQVTHLAISQFIVLASACKP